MQIRDRIKELRRIQAKQLRPNPRNWRVHPASQQDAMRGILAEIGYADALLVRKTADGAYELIDGHLRAETTPDIEVPVLVLDLNEEEAAKLLALHDPLAAMAETDHEMLADLVETIETENEALQTTLQNLLDEEPDSPEPVEDDGNAKEVALHEAYQVVIECKDEIEQQEVFERMQKEGFRCRLMMI